MLLSLRVKNLALIESAEIEFDSGLNILTGETGAGKSVVIGSAAIALGGKIPKDIIRKGADYAYVELIFLVDGEEKKKYLEEMDVVTSSDGTIIISKKIMPSRSVSRINDETVTAAKLRQITGLLIDIHGQHEHQSLLYQTKHLEILDQYLGNKSLTMKQNIAEVYRRYLQLKNQLKSYDLDQDARLREADFCRFQIDEIQQAQLYEAEEKELEVTFSKMSHGKQIMKGLSCTYDAVNMDQIGRALKEMEEVVSYDKRLQQIRDQLYDVDVILSDINHAVSSCIDEMDYSEHEFEKVQKRLDLIHNLESKYGAEISDVFKSLELKKIRLEELENYDILQEKIKNDLEKITNDLYELCRQLSIIRKSAAVELTQKIKESLVDLNFINVEFEMKFTQMDHVTQEGFDQAEFVISTNPGESLKPLSAVASGGELSRIMLAIKTVLADSDEIPTLIFDEIDTGISGRTAQKVSEKLSYLGKRHQVICITHLPQIAAMADRHFAIEKSARDGRTTTVIVPLKRKQMVEELARLLGGTEITETVLKSAQEMKELADKTKSNN